MDYVQIDTNAIQSWQIFHGDHMLVLSQRLLSLVLQPERALGNAWGNQPQEILIGKEYLANTLLQAFLRPLDAERWVIRVVAEPPPKHKTVVEMLIGEYLYQARLDIKGQAEFIGLSHKDLMPESFDDLFIALSGGDNP
ncbi:MAG: hypothetical protein HC822_05765 [Oscillochloris sp.]|nr:hypothetical protein [Oscillochloris sp.]